MDAVGDLLMFLQPNQRLDLRAGSLTYVLGLSGSAEGKAVLFDLPETVYAILLLTQDSNSSIAKDAVLTVINLTSNKPGVQRVLATGAIVTPTFDVISIAIENILNPNSSLADPWSMVLSNVTRVEDEVDPVIQEILSVPGSISGLVKAFGQLDYNKRGCSLNYLAPIFCNITQTMRGRDLFCRPEHNILEKLVPFISFKMNTVRRGGIIGVFKNICFDPIYHNRIIDENSGVFHNLLLPLAGPEEFTYEENEKLPMALQYLGDDKEREEDPDLRRMLLECLLQLCATKKIREYLRAKGVYEILREYHKWEQQIGGDQHALQACENVVEILIKKEEEIGVDNLKDVQIPLDLSKKFTESENLFLHD